MLIGEGEAFYQGERMTGGEALRAAGIEPVVLEAKEGLALINGTQMMTAVGALTLWEAENISKAADIAAAQAVEALRGTNTPYLEISHRVRPHAGQAATARNLLRLLEHSEILASHVACGKVQDAYSLRCVPQVHGAVKDALAFVRGVLEVEIELGHRQPAGLPRGGDGHLRGQLPRSADLAGHGHPGYRSGPVGQHLRAAHRVHDGPQHVGPSARPS